MSLLFRFLFGSPAGPASGPLSRWANRGVLVGFYLLGLAHWAYFLDWGKIPFDLHDWTQAGAYFDFLRRAVLAGRLPLHVSSSLLTTDRYLARPDTLFSPQALLLGLLKPGPFFLVNVLLLFTLGFAGLVWIGAQYRLSPAAFTALFLLFNFNGQLTAHIAVGHTVWTAYFLLPYFVLLILRWIDDRRLDWHRITLVALVLVFMALQGGFHFFLWCLFFLLILGLASPALLRPVAITILSSALLGLFRLAPPAIEYIHGGPPFISGFPTLTDLASGLVVIIHPSQALSGPLKSLGGWEIDFFVGLAGLGFLLFFGLWETWQKQGPGRVLLAPMFGLAFLSIGRIYQPIHSLPIPLVDSERITSRFLILPLVFLIVLGAIHFQEFLNRRLALGTGEGLLALGLLALLGHDLLQHSRIWRVSNLGALFPSTPVDLRAPLINHPDPPYFLALALGAAGSLLTLAFLVWQARKEARSENMPLEPST